MVTLLDAKYFPDCPVQEEQHSVQHRPGFKDVCPEASVAGHASDMSYGLFIIGWGMRIRRALAEPDYGFFPPDTPDDPELVTARVPTITGQSALADTEVDLETWNCKWRYKPGRHWDSGVSQGSLHTLTSVFLYTSTTCQPSSLPAFAGEDSSLPLSFER